jgi:hypothetical protein
VFGGPTCHTASVAERWTPQLHVSETSGRCRLRLDGYAYGEGPTLQEAADDLVHRLLTLAMCLRSGSGFTVSAEGPSPDFHWLEFLYKLGEIAARGGDIRQCVFGEASGDASSG